MESVSLYTEARNEYLKQLSLWIVPPLVEFFRKEYNTIAEKDSRKAMGQFQAFCAEVPRWNQDVIDTNTGALLDTCRCDYVEELMTAVFIAHTKMLTAIRVSTKHKKLQITLPKLDHFLHRVFIECARSFWKAPFLFASELSPIEKQKNVLQAEAMCTESLSGAVRSLLPVKNILRDYLDDEEGDDKPAEEKAANELEDEEEVVAEAVTSDETAAAAVTTAATTVPATTVAVTTAPTTAPVTTMAVPAAATAAVTTAATTVASAPATVEVASTEPIIEPSVENKVAATAVAATEAVATVAVAAAVTDVVQEPKEPVIVLEKLPTPPELPVTPTVSEHAVTTPVVTSPVSVEKTNANPPHLTIETEPTVHFTPYDTVFHDTKDSEITYAPKVSVEDLPPSTWGLEEVPKLTIQNTSTAMSLADVEDLEPRPASEDIDAPLQTTGDFEVLDA